MQSADAMGLWAVHVFWWESKIVWPFCGMDRG